MTSHTPGPWKAFLLNDAAEVEYGPAIVADCRASVFYQGEGRLYEIGISECHANARLIAAAPDLLRAAQLALVAITKPPIGASSEYTLDSAESALKNAIAKAEGESDE